MPIYWRKAYDQIAEQFQTEKSYFYFTLGTFIIIGTIFSFAFKTPCPFVITALASMVLAIVQEYINSETVNSNINNIFSKVLPIDRPNKTVEKNEIFAPSKCKIPPSMPPMIGMDAEAYDKINDVCQSDYPVCVRRPDVATYHASLDPLLYDPQYACGYDDGGFNMYRQ